MYIGLSTEEQEKAGMAIHQRKGFWHHLDNRWSIKHHGYCIACTNDFVRGWNAVMNRRVL